MAVLKGLGGVLIGFGAGLAASSAVPGAGSAIRPVAKGLVRGVLAAVDGLKQVLAEASEQLSDLVAEVRAESAEEGGDGEPPRRRAVRQSRPTGPRPV
jgi:hypothetical protein